MSDLPTAPFELQAGTSRRLSDQSSVRRNQLVGFVQNKSSLADVADDRITMVLRPSLSTDEGTSYRLGGY